MPLINRLMQLINWKCNEFANFAYSEYLQLLGSCAWAWKNKVRKRWCLSVIFERPLEKMGKPKSSVRIYQIQKWLVNEAVHFLKNINVFNIMIWGLVTSSTPILNHLKPPYRKPIPQQALNNHSAILSSHNFEQIKNFTILNMFDPKDQNQIPTTFHNKTPPGCREKWKLVVESSLEIPQ